MAIPRSLARRAETSVALTAEQAPLLAEALRLGEATRNQMEDALVDYGRWILVHIFNNDAAAALDAKSENPLWTALLSRAGGPTLRMSRKVLYVSVEIAARDKRINDDIWRALEPGRKELLLPLSDETQMREAAKHVVEMKLSYDKTREYVATLRTELGEAPKKRVTVRGMANRVRAFHTSVGDASVLQSLKKVSAKASEDELSELRAEVDAVAAWVTLARRAIRK